MEEVEFHSIKTEVIYQHDRMYMQYFEQSEKSLRFEGQSYSAPELNVRNHKIFRIQKFEQNQFNETLLAIDPKLAELLMAIDPKELFEEAKQAYFEELKSKLSELTHNEAIYRKSTEHYFSQLYKLTCSGWFQRLKFVFIGIPDLDLFKSY